MGEDDHIIPVIGRGESLATGFVNPSTTTAPNASQITELEAHAENEEPSPESEADFDEFKKHLSGDDGDVENAGGKELSAERQAAIESLKDSMGWIFPKVKVS